MQKHTKYEWQTENGKLNIMQKCANIYTSCQLPIFSLLLLLLYFFGADAWQQCGQNADPQMHGSATQAQTQTQAQSQAMTRRRRRWRSGDWQLALAAAAATATATASACGSYCRGAWKTIFMANKFSYRQQTAPQIYIFCCFFFWLGVAHPTPTMQQAATIGGMCEYAAAI